MGNIDNDSKIFFFSVVQKHITEQQSQQKNFDGQLGAMEGPASVTEWF